MSLKLRLNLIVSSLLLIVMLVGIILNIVNAHQNSRAEVASAEKLALYVFDTRVLNTPDFTLQKPINSYLRLQSLRGMRHLKIEFFDTHERKVDSNLVFGTPKLNNEAPDWFINLMDLVTPKWQSQYREIRNQSTVFGQLVITPDPTYEYAEIWKQITDLFFLLCIFFVLVNLIVYWAVEQALKPTEKVLEALTNLERGNLKTRLPIFELPELTKISDKFNHMAETLEKSINHNHRLSQQLISLQEEERKSLARDLHDEFGQCLTAIHADSNAVLILAERKYPEILESSKAITKLSRHLMNLVSGLMQQLRPSTLDELGLTYALQDLVESWKSHNKGVDCKLTMDESVSVNKSEKVQITIYRLVQECLTNISRHAEASKVEVSLLAKFIESRPHGLQIYVHDNGKGFNVNNAGGFGLLGMRERVEGLGGELFIDASKDNGTTIVACFPLEDYKS